MSRYRTARPGSRTHQRGRQDGFAAPKFALRCPQWKRGAELPPFVSANTDAMLFLRAVLDGTAELTGVAVSRAVVRQIYLLVFGPESRSEMLEHTYDTFYRIIVSLKEGYHGNLVSHLPIGFLAIPYAKSRNSSLRGTEWCLARAAPLPRRQRTSKKR